MSTVSWTPFGVELNLTATTGKVVRTSASQFTVVITASWKTHYSGAKTNYGMKVTSGGKTIYIPKYDGNKYASGSGSLTGTYSISGNGAQTKSITVSFVNYKDDADKPSATKTMTFDISVPAWTSYTVTYNANGGTGAPSKQTKWKDQALTLSSTKPTRTGYSFLGWATTASATSAKYAAGASYTSNASATLYAVWKANTYTVTYNANGGSGAPGSQTKTHDVSLKLSSTKPTRENYNFLGWSGSSTASTPSYAAGSMYTTNKAITLYAVWELAYVKPTITDLSVARCDESGRLSDDGTYCRVQFKWAASGGSASINLLIFDARGNQLGLGTVISTGVTVFSGQVDEIIGSGNLQTDASYSVVIRVTDIDSYERTVTLPGNVYVIDFYSSARGGVAFGKPAEIEGLMDIAYKTRFLGGIDYPVISPETDLNTLTTTGFYVGMNASSNDYANCPITSGTFTLEVLSSGDSGQLYQRLTQCDKNKPAVFERFYYSSAWGSWYGGWIYPELGSEFAMYGTDEGVNRPRYRKDGRIVEIRGIVRPVVDIAGSVSNHNIFNIPVGYRPSSPLYILCQGSGTCVWMLQVSSGGEVNMSRYRNGTEFVTASGSGDGAWLPFHVTYIV